MGDTKHGQLGFQNPNDNQNNAKIDNNSDDEGDHYLLKHVISRPKMCSYNILIK